MAILLKHGYQAPVHDVFGIRGREWLGTLPLRPVYQQALQGYLQILDVVRSQIDVASEEVDREAKATPQAQLLCTLPGVGHYTALLLLAEIGDVSRFPSPKHLVSYAGLAPTVHASGGHVHTGHISKQGSSWLRWILIEAALHAIRKPGQFQDLYQRLAKRKVNWDPPLPYPSIPAFWIDMTLYHADPNNYGAEHNFRIRALGASGEVYVDGQETPIATLTSSGWYTFLMTWRKAANAADPVITDMNVYDSSHNLLGNTTVYATSPGGPFASSDLRGNGYVWITVWRNGFADDLLAIDNQRTGLLPWPVPTSKDHARMKVGG